MSVLPVLALPGWFVERSGRGDVRVFNGRELAGLLRSRGAASLSDQEVAQIAHQVGAAVSHRCSALQRIVKGYLTQRDPPSRSRGARGDDQTFGV